MSTYAEMSPAAREQHRRARAARTEREGGQPSGMEKWPWVPAAIMVALIEPLAAEIGWSSIAARAGLTERRLYDIRTSLTRVGFDTADKLICLALGAPQLWHEIPELAAVYREGL